MYIPEGEVGFRLYWEDMCGERNTLFTSALNQEQALSEGMEYIRDRLYMASFTIVGLEKSANRCWEKIEISRLWCKGRLK